MRIYHYAVLLLLALSSCTCNKATVSPGSPETTGETTEVAAKSPEWLAIEKNMDAYFGAQKKGDFETFADYSMPRLFELVPRADIIAGMKSHYDQGLHQGMDNIAITRISDFVEDSLYRYCLVQFTGTMWVKFLPEYPTDPMVMYNQIKEEHGEENMKYDEANREYTIEREFKVYAISPKDSMNFTFLNHGFVRSSMAGDIMDFEVLRTLRSYE